MRIWTPIEAYKYAYRYSLKFPRDAKISEHFYWCEVFKNQQNEACPPVIIFFNALKAAEELEKYRTHSGHSINVHRWFSTPRYNKEVVYGGNGEKGSLSLHTLALAIDFDETGRTSEETRLNMMGMINKDLLRMRIERDTQGWVHADTSCELIFPKPVYGLFYP